MPEESESVPACDIFTGQIDHSIQAFYIPIVC